MRGVARLRHALASMPRADHEAGWAVRERAAQILRPQGALARLDEIAAWVAEWQRTPTPAVRHPACAVFAADHGVAVAGVSHYPIDVTAAMLAAYRARRSTVTTFATIAGATVHAIDVGVGHPTGDIRHEPALTSERLDECIEAGFNVVDEIVASGADLLAVGEMGIGNTTIAAALATALAARRGEPADADTWTGRGTGVDDEGLARKRTAVTAAVQRTLDVDDPIDLLRHLGGAELTAIAAAVVAARHAGLPVLLDGYVTTAAVLPLAMLDTSALAHCRVGHCSAEPGHRQLLGALGMRPLLDLDMRLAEGSGAVAAIPLVAMACAGVVEVPTFAEWFG